MRHETEMRYPIDGVPQRAHLQQLVERGQIKARALMEGPRMPANRAHLWPTWDAIQYLWDWFWELNRTRTYNGMTGRPDPITYQALDAWARLTGRELLPHEVDALMRLDVAYLESVAKLAKQHAPTTGPGGAH